MVIQIGGPSDFDFEAWVTGAIESGIGIISSSKSISDLKYKF